MKTNTINYGEIDKLTEHSDKFKLFNMTLTDCYNALSPSSLSKISMILFNCLLYTKRYDKPGGPFYSEEEARRIYTNILITPEIILDRYDPKKYRIEKKDIKTDISNLNVKLTDLHDMNIFYMWRYGTPFTLMFVLERNIFLWKYYNPEAYVVPKTLQKIIRSANGMIKTMTRLEASRGRPTSVADIERSFMRDFLPSIIAKMSPKISSRFPMWDGGMKSSEYLTLIRNQLDKIENKYEGLQNDHLIADRFPTHIRKKISAEEFNILDESSKNKEGGKPMDISQLEKDLVPTNENIVKEKRIKNPKSLIDDNRLKPEGLSFKSLDPFVNCNQFLKFYRDVIRMYNSRARFYGFDVERNSALEIMDMMTEHGRSGNKEFLKSWIRYYITNTLRGNSVYKTEKTSLRAFKETFSEFNNKYIG